MKWTSIKNTKNYLLFFIVIFLIAIITGFISFNKLNVIYSNEFNDLIVNKHLYNINAYHIILPLLSGALSLIFIGFLLIIINVFLEGFSIGTNIILFMKFYKIKGLLYILLYLLITKLIYIFLLYLAYINIIKIIKRIIEKNYKEAFFVLKKIYILTVIMIANEFIIKIFANKLILLLQLLIK